MFAYQSNDSVFSVMQEIKAMVLATTDLERNGEETIYARPQSINLDPNLILSCLVESKQSI